MKHLKNNKKNNKAFYSVFGVIIIAACVFLAIECATSGAEMANLIEKQEMLEKEKKDLNAKLVDLSSLNVIQEKALSFGFQKPQRVVYIQESEEFASLLP